MNALQSLPADDGFRFDGIHRDGSREQCVMLVVPADGRVHYRAHALDGTDVERELVGWLPLPTDK